MISSVQNYDFICLQMRNLRPQVDTSLDNEIDKLINDVKSIISADKNIEDDFDKLLPKVFVFRLKALKWLLEEEGLDLKDLMDEVYPMIEEMKQNERLEVLVENILFALRSNKRVIESIVKYLDQSEDFNLSDALQIPEITYKQFIETLAYIVPNTEMAQKIVDMSSASLRIELVALTASIIYDEDLKVNNQLINHLSFFIANAAQEYSALAIELGLVKSFHSNEMTSITGKEGVDFNEEQKILAELDLNDFAKVFRIQ